MKRETVAEAVADELAAAGVDRVFGLPGGEVLHLIDALRRRGVEFVLCRHEADAGLMAAVYGKLRGVPGVVLTTLGPGATNLMLPLANSLLDREPLIAISAQVPDSWGPTRIHQRLPLLEVFTPLVKLAKPLTPMDCRQVVRSAVAASATEPVGPSYLTLSADVAVAPSLVPAASNHASPNGRSELGDSGAADELRKRLAEAERPVVVVGLGARPEDAQQILRWIEAWNLPVAVTPKIKGIIDETHRLFGGVVGGMCLDRAMVAALSEADLVVGLGLDPTEIDGDWHERLPMLWVLESAWATSVVPEADAIACQHRAVLERLAEEAAPRQWVDPLVGVRLERRRVAEGPAGGPGYLSPVGVVRALAAALPPTTIVTTDVGSHKYLFGQFWPSREPQTFFMSNGLSGMGYGLPAAIGAKLARPEAPVLAVLGDGGFSMNSQELETARRIGAPILVAVLSDQSYSLIQVGQQRRGLERYGVDFEAIDTVLAARSCGVRGCRVTSEEELTECAREAGERGETTVIEIPIRAEDYVPIL